MSIRQHLSGSLSRVSIKWLRKLFSLPLSNELVLFSLTVEMKDWNTCTRLDRSHKHGVMDSTLMTTVRTISWDKSGVKNGVTAEGANFLHVPQLPSLLLDFLNSSSTLFTVTLPLCDSICYDRCIYVTHKCCEAVVSKGKIVLLKLLVRKSLIWNKKKTLPLPECDWPSGPLHYWFNQAHRGEPVLTCCVYVRVKSPP